MAKTLLKDLTDMAPAKQGKEIGDLAEKYGGELLELVALWEDFLKENPDVSLFALVGTAFQMGYRAAAKEK